MLYTFLYDFFSSAYLFQDSSMMFHISIAYLFLMLKSICYINNTRNLFIHSPMECWWTFGFFYICITNKPTMNICYKFFVRTFAFGLIQVNTQEQEWLDCGKCMLKKLTVFSESSCIILHLHQQYEHFNCSVFLPTTGSKS